MPLPRARADLAHSCSVLQRPLGFLAGVLADPAGIVDQPRQRAAHEPLCELRRTVSRPGGDPATHRATSAWVPRCWHGDGQSPLVDTPFGPSHVQCSPVRTRRSRSIEIGIIRRHDLLGGKIGTLALEDHLPFDAVEHARFSEFLQAGGIAGGDTATCFTVMDLLLPLFAGFDRRTVNPAERVNTRFRKFQREWDFSCCGIVEIDPDQWPNLRRNKGVSRRPLELLPLGLDGTGASNGGMTRPGRALAK